MVGTHEQQFDRIVKAVDELESEEKKIIQYGYSNYQPVNSVSYDFLPFDEVKQHMLDASVIITHAGTGSVMLALSLGRRPIVVPRYRKYGEHVDDHQQQLVETLMEDGLIVPLFDGDDLQDRIQEVRSAGKERRKIEPDSRLVSELRMIIDQA